MESVTESSSALEQLHKFYEGPGVERLRHREVKKKKKGETIRLIELAKLR